MYLPIEECALRLLRERAEPAVSLDWLHDELRARGEAAGATRRHLAERLRRRSDVCVVVDGPPRLDTSGWPPELRREYEDAFDHAGLETGACVVLLENPAPYPDEPPEAHHAPTVALATQVRTGLVALCRGLATEPDGHEALLAALDGARQVCRVLEPDVGYRDSGSSSTVHHSPSTSSAVIR